MAIRVVGLVRRMRPTNLSRPRIKMHSYDGTFSASRSLSVCSSLSKRAMPAFLRRALNDGVQCASKNCVTRPGTRTMTISAEQIHKCAKPMVQTLPSRSSRCRSPSQLFPSVNTYLPSTLILMSHCGTGMLRLRCHFSTMSRLCSPLI